MTEIIGNISMRGEYQVTKWRRGEDQPYEVSPWVPNAVQAGGRYLLLRRLLDGTSTDSSAFPMNNANATLILRDSVGTVVKTLQAVPPTGWTNPDFSLLHTIRWKWRDNSSSVYAPASATVRNATSGGYDFSITSGLQSSPYSWGTKPDYEIWDYEYRFQLAASGAIQDGFIDHLRYTLSDYHPSQGAGGSIARTYFKFNTQFTPGTWSGLDGLNTSSSTTITGNLVTSPSTGSTACSWSFLSDIGDNNGFDWSGYKIDNAGIILRTGSGLITGPSGQKSSTQRWTYTYTLTCT